ncbi:MAG: hypothetical protein NTY65_01260 [Planctomycetota bacterium]|nr:hypothetical protein [Planctomycetota bacterium]
MKTRWLLIVATLPMAALLAGCSASDRRLPAGPPPEVTPYELLIQHNAWVDAHSALCARADLPAFARAPALLQAFCGFRIDPKPDREMELDDIGVHAVLTEHGPGGNATRRTWFNRYTLRPERVEVYDRGGRCVLSAEMLGYERIGAVDVCSVFRARTRGSEEVSVEIDLVSLGSDARPEYSVVEHRAPQGG